MTIAFLGLGAMGSRMAARLIAADYTLAVYNRTPERAADLVALGATARESPRAAAQEADIVIAMVHGDEASHSVWLDASTGALSAMKPDAIAVECSTLSVSGTWQLADAMGDQPFLVAPVVGSRPQAEGGALGILVGGEASVFAQAERVLEAMGNPKYIGTPEQAASAKLAVNALFAVQASAMAEVLALLEASGIDRARASEFLSGLPVTSPAAARLAGLMARGEFAPNFPIELVAKDLGYACGAAGPKAVTIAGARAAFDAAAAAGWGGDDIAGIAQRVLA